MSESNNNIYDDPKLTAYALGELDVTEAAEIETLIADDVAARKVVDEIRQTAKQLESEFADEPKLSLNDSQRDAVKQSAEQAPFVETRSSFLISRRFWMSTGLAAAACLVLSLSLPMFWEDEEITQFALSNKTLDSIAAAELKHPGPPNASMIHEEPMRFNISPQTDMDGDGFVGLWSVDSPNNPTNDNYELLKAKPTLSIRNGRVVAGDGVTVTDYSSVDLAVQDNELGNDLALWNLEQKVQPTPTITLDSTVDSRAPSNVNPQVALRRKPIPTPGSQIGGMGNGGGGSVLGRRKKSSPGYFHNSQQPLPLLGDIPILPDSLLTFSNDRLMLGDFSPEAYARIVDNKFMRVGEQPLSTFSIDVDTASYANMRRFINGGSLPPPDAVRIEELLNYFNYDYAGPSETDEHPFATHVEVATCPWNTKHRLVHIGIKGREIESDMRPATNLVFLLDVSGSMNQPNKLPLVKRSMQLLIDHLTVDDRVAIVVYAGASGLVLPSTYCTDKQVILSAIERLHAGGSTNGGAGIELAYNTAAESFIEGGVNRVILCTDGDFNVGISSDGDLVRLIEEKRKSHIFLSVLGFGTGNWQDSKMEQLSNAGNGNFAYIDSLQEANKVLVEEMGGTLITIAKDVKIQIEFNPAVVSSYRLIGYENRVLAAQDFNDDTKDAGEIGAGHTVTALYEIVLVGDEEELTIADTPPVDDLKYQNNLEPNEAAKTTGEMMTVKLRYKEPEGDVSKLLEYPVMDEAAELTNASADFKFASAVASFGMILRGSPHKGNATFKSVLYLARAGLSDSSDMGQAHRFLEDFIHYTLIAKPELAMFSAWGLKGASGICDVDRNDIVNESDLLVLINNWGLCEESAGATWPGDSEELAAGFTTRLSRNNRNADLDNNGIVDKADLELLYAAWGSSIKGSRADLDANGKVDTFDLIELLANWGQATKQ